MFEKLFASFSGFGLSGRSHVARDVAEFPPMVMIDTTTRCNLACEHCPHRILAARPGFLGDMDPSLFRKIIDEIAIENRSTLVRPFDGGEPLVRKDMELLIGYAKDKGIARVSINTNGLLLTPERCRSLVMSGLDHVEISIDAATAETYKKIRGSDGFARLQENIQSLLAVRKSLASKLEVSVSFVLQEANRHERDQFLAMWSDRVERVYIRKWHQHNSLVQGPGPAKPKGRRNRHPCPYLWDRMIIHHDGRVRFCEADWECLHPLGDVRTQTLKEIWQGEAYRRLRESHLAGTFDHPFCHECSDWQVITW